MEDSVVEELNTDRNLALHESVYSQNGPYQDNILRGTGVYTENHYSFPEQHQMFQTTPEQPVTVTQQPIPLHEGIHDNYRQTDVVDDNPSSSNGKTKYTVLSISSYKILKITNVDFCQIVVLLLTKIRSIGIIRIKSVVYGSRTM